MATKRPSLKIHKTTMWIFICVVLVFVVITLIALNDSAERNGRKLMPGKHGIKYKKERSNKDG
ncbi:hypothetical protein HUW51_21260 [Adhaeribacter swui]|uniref:Uncharacterized protein n=1 Tax=Adhaeribacter swui TaxID=2086471 RepID=A0A7G7GD88_9BACT|nr:hypothetical protein [Adhaeribacter swui]QNF35122.1 hypothetical protein HUW51_21260 [Adhaeribacter swui]